MGHPNPALVDARALYKAIEVINHLAVELDVDVALASVRQCALELLECEKVTLFLINEVRRELRGQTCDQEDSQAIIVNFGEGIAGTVAENGGLMNIQDAYTHPLFNPEIDKQTRFRTRSILCCAISDTSGRSVAVLQALNKQSGAFTQADEHMLQLFGVHLGNTLTKSRYYEEAKREKLRLATLRNCFKQLSAVESLGGALDTIAAAARELVSARHAVVLLMDNARQVLWTSIVDHRTTDRPTLSFHVKRDQGVIAQCAADKQQVTLCFPGHTCMDSKLLQLFELLSRGHTKLSETLLQPVVDPASDKCLAVLCALNKQPESETCNSLLYEQTFTASDCDALNLFSMEVADVLSARSLEVSFASAISIVNVDGGTAEQDQVSNMLRAQLMDYAPQQAGVDDLSRTSSCQLQHSVSGAGASRRRSDGGCTLTANDSLSARARRSSSSEVSDGGASSLPQLHVGQLSPMRSFRHHIPPVGATTSDASGASMRTKYTTWELDCSTMQREELTRLAYDLFKLSGVLDDLQLSDSELTGFLSAVAAHYHPDVPYHNLAHAVQVLHTVWMFLETTTVRNVLSCGEELVLLVAALCHDLDHDGHTNSFHVHAQTDLAQRYNDKSVQENHHCALTAHILRQQGSNLLQRFTGADWWQARRLLIDAILCTDMHHHFALTQELQKHSLLYLSEDEGDRTLLVKAILHAADISNHTRPFPAALAAAERVHREFLQQATQEKQLGRPVAPHMDAEDPAVWAEMDVQFIDYVAGPLWERLGQVFPTLQQPISTMHVNRAKFAAMAQSRSSDLANTESDRDVQNSSVCASTFFGRNRRRTTKAATSSTSEQIKGHSQHSSQVVGADTLATVTSNSR